MRRVRDRSIHKQQELSQILPLLPRVNVLGRELAPVARRFRAFAPVERLLVVVAGPLEPSGVNLGRCGKCVGFGHFYYYLLCKASRISASRNGVGVAFASVFPSVGLFAFFPR